MRPWWVALLGVAALLVVQAIANEPTLEEEEEEEEKERIRVEEVTQAPPVTPPSRAGSGDEMLLSLCPPKKALRTPQPKTNLLVVSTLDGQLTALDLANRGEMVWSSATQPGPLLSSTISAMELDDRGQFMKLIPSLNGKLYKFNGEHVEPMHLDANSFVSYSLKMQKNLIFTGGKESRTVGLDLATGEAQYHCSMEGRCSRLVEAGDDLKDILVVQRNTQTVRAHEARNGEEKWNFSVSLHDLAFHPGRELCDDEIDELESNAGDEEEEDNFSIKTVVPEGVICAVDKEKQDQIKWRRKFQSPIVDAWRITGKGLKQVDLFSRNSVPRKESLLDDDDDPDDDEPPQLYIGRHENQLYIQESILMQMQTEEGLREYNLNPTGSETTFPRVSWKPYLVSPSRTPYFNHDGNSFPLLSFDQRLKEADPKSTALAITRDDADYPYDSGYFLYPDRVSLTNGSNMIITEEEAEDDQSTVSVQFIYMNLWHWWKEVIFISMVTAFMMNFLLYRPYMEWNYQERSRALVQYFQDNRNQVVVEKVIVEKVVEVPVPAFNASATPTTPSTNSSKSWPDLASANATLSRSNSDFVSRYFSDFEPITCLGRGGFGVVFESKNKYDDIHYAVKRITLPHKEERRKKVKREVRVLAKLEHRNIVRYFSTREETPPIGWQEEMDVWFADQHLGSAAPSLGETQDATSADFSQSFQIQLEPPKPLPLVKPHNPLKLFSPSVSSGQKDGSFSVVLDTSSGNFSTSNCDSDSSDSDEEGTGLLPREESSFGVSFCDKPPARVRFGDESSGGVKFCDESSGGVRFGDESSAGARFADKFQRRGKKHILEERGEPEAVSVVMMDSNSNEESGGCIEALRWEESKGEKLICLASSEKVPRQKAFLYIVMQLCCRETLSHWLASHTQRSREEIIDIFKQICVGVEYVHSMGLVHRDLKPSNIYFSNETERVIKIGDFGLVTHSDLGSEDNGTPTKSGSINIRGESQLTDQVGTHTYMSPEQLEQQPYNHKVDIYSLGLIFLELLAPTNTGMERIMILSDARRGEFPKELTGSPELLLLQDMLHRNPERRPEARAILCLSWLQGRRRLNTSSSGEDFREDILWEEELDN